MVLIDIDDLKQRLELVGEDGEVTTDPKQDTFLQSCVDQANAIVSGIVGRDITYQEWTEYVSGHGGCYLELRNGPLVTLTSVDLVRRTGTGTVYTTQDLDLVYVNGSLADGGKLPSSLFRETGWETGFHNYRVVAYSGFTTIPKEIMDAALFAAVAIRNRRKDAGTSARDMGAGSGRVFRSELEVRSDVRSMVRAYVDIRTPL